MFDTRTALARLSGRPVEEIGSRRRWPYLGPAQPRMVLAAAGLIVGSFLPWVDSAVGTFSGMAGAGVWTLYAGVVALGSVMLRRPWLAAANAAVAGLTAVGLTLWQGIRIARYYQGGAVAPSTGLVLVFAAGVFALVQVWPLWRYDPQVSREEGS